MSSQNQTNSSGLSYQQTFAPNISGDPMQELVVFDPGVAVSTSYYDTAVAGSPESSASVAGVTGNVTNYTFAPTSAGDPVSQVVAYVPNVSTTTYSYSAGAAGDPLSSMTIAYGGSAATDVVYGIAGQSWSSVTAYYNTAGVNTELNTDYKNNTSVTQLFAGQAQGWSQQTFDYTGGLVTENTINFTNGWSYAMVYSGYSLYYYMERSPTGPYTVTYEDIGNNQGWSNYTYYYNASGGVISTVAGFPGYSLVNGNTIVLGNGADVPSAAYVYPGQFNNDPYGSPVPADFGTTGGNAQLWSFGPTVTISGQLSGANPTISPDDPAAGGGGATPNAAPQVVSVNALSAGASSAKNGSGIQDSNVIDSGTGNLTLTGTGLDPTYLIQGSSASQVISNASSFGPAASGEVAFSKADADQLWFVQSGANLLVDVLGTKEQVTVQDWFSNPAAQVTEFVSADNLKLDTMLNTLVQAMATYSAGHGVFNPQAAGAGMPADNALQVAIASAWHV